QYDSMALSQNAQGIDDWYFAQGGFRMDTDFGESRFSLQGQYADSDTGTLTDIIDPGFPPTFFRASDDDIQYSLGHLMGRYDHSFDEDHDLTFQLFYDYFDLRTENITRFRIHTVDTEFQHRSPLGDRQEVIFGLGYRYYPITSGSNAAPAFEITDAQRHDQLFSFFVQDEIRVVEETLHLTVGTKVEYQDIIDSWEFMPQARLAWMPDETQTYWASISRAVRSPSFINVGIDGILPATPLGPNPLLPAPLNALNTFFRRDISVNKPKAEDVLGVELGVRIQPSEDTSLDFAAFYNEFDDLFALRLDLDPALVQVPTNPVPFISIPFVENNDMEGESYGFEIAGPWAVSDAWRMTGWYALQSDNTNATSTFISVPSEGSAPRHMVTVRSAFDILTDWEFDVIFRYADRVESTNASSYLTFDLRLGWRPSEDLSIVLIGRNLVEARHQEFGASAILSQQTSLVERAGILEIVYRF
ncbi:MAG: TonB-dependent receptor, partial [Planctomycetota bacterium]|nr:TonB-dependent receptor [Planctomycetota bacterium]